MLKAYSDCMTCVLSNVFAHVEPISDGLAEGKSHISSLACHHPSCPHNHVIVLSTLVGCQQLDFSLKEALVTSGSPMHTLQYIVQG